MILRTILTRLRLHKAVKSRSTFCTVQFYFCLHSRGRWPFSPSQVFGLGNKTYEHYNKVAIYVDKRLEELGGTRVFELGLGDDDAKWV